MRRQKLGTLHTPKQTKDSYYVESRIVDLFVQCEARNRAHLRYHVRIFIVAIDFGIRAVAVYNQVKVASNSPLTNIQQPLIQLPLVVVPQKLPQFPIPGYCLCP